MRQALKKLQNAPIGATDAFAKNLIQVKIGNLCKFRCVSRASDPGAPASLCFVAHVLNSRASIETMTLRHFSLSGRHFEDGSIIHDHLNALG